VTERPGHDTGPEFVTVAMAEILLDQALVEEARKVIEELRTARGDDPKVLGLVERLEATGRPAEPIPVTPLGRDRSSLTEHNGVLTAEWELTEGGLALARRRARYSGVRIIRLFSAAPGPRGVRSATRDTEVALLAGRLELRGLPRPAVHVLAVGFLSHTGQFVPLARSEPLTVRP
jgi:hypothetical protein